jgi:hypothetical protein
MAVDPDDSPQVRQHVTADGNAFVAGHDIVFPPGTAADEDARARKKLWQRQGWIIAGVIVAIIGLAGAITPIVLDQGLPRPVASLQLDSLTVESYTALHPGATLGGPDTLDFKFRNLGAELALITGVRISVQHVTEAVRVACNFTPVLPVSALYGTTLPLVSPRSGTTTLTVSVSETVSPDQADRFDIRLSLPTGACPGAIYAYELNISILYNGNRAINAGRLLVALPENPPKPLPQYFTSARE